jgi:hypothetical protein
MVGAGESSVTEDEELEATVDCVFARGTRILRPAAAKSKGTNRNVFM